MLFGNSASVTIQILEVFVGVTYSVFYMDEKTCSVFYFNKV